MSDKAQNRGTFMQILPGPSFGKPDRGRGSCCGATNRAVPKAWGRTFGSRPFIRSGCCLSPQLSPVCRLVWHGWPRGGSQHSRAEAKRGRAAQGAQPLAETAGTVSRGMGCLRHQGTFPCCGEAKLTWLLRPHQSSEQTGLKMHRVWCNKLGCCQA